MLELESREGSTNAAAETVGLACRYLREDFINLLKARLAMYEYGMRACPSSRFSASMSELNFSSHGVLAAANGLGCHMFPLPFSFVPRSLSPSLPSRPLPLRVTQGKFQMETSQVDPRRRSIASVDVGCAFRNRMICDSNPKPEWRFSLGGKKRLPRSGFPIID